MPEERPRHTHGEPQKASASGWQLVAVQSISCVIVIAIVFIFRMVGGSAFAQLRKSFNQSIMDNSIIGTLASLWDNANAYMSDASDASDDSTVSDDSGSSENESETATASSQESSGTTAGGSAAAATTSAKAESTATTVVTKATVAASGGSDLPVSSTKLTYAPEGASFVPLKVNRLACKPLEKGKITSCFGFRENPTKGGESFHQGLDIGTDSGTPIAAMYFGVVSEVGKNSSYGNYIRLYHGNGIEVLYAHCSEILVQKGTVVKAGEIVAKVGSTGDSTGPHLHVEVKLKGINYNPDGIVPTEDYA